MWVRKAEAGLVGRDLESKATLRWKILKKRLLRPQELISDFAAGGQRRQQLIASCRKDTGTHREECG